MNRLNPYLQDLQKEFRENYPEGPKLIVKCKEKSTEESFRATYSGGAVTLEAEGQQAAIFGIGLISAGVASGHLGECLGVRAPKFPLRPLWFSSMENVEEICRRVLALGYNAVLLEREGDVERLVLFREYGIKVILKPEPDLPEGKCFLDQEYRDAVREGLRALQQEVPRVDGFFWEGLFGQKDINLHPGARDLLQVDMALKEVRLLEEAILGDRFLIYYISCTDLQNAQQQAAWLPSFCNDVGKQTIIAFSAVSGDPVLDHLDSHPFWEVLRQSLDVCYTPLLPIINVGALNQGECLWPTLALDLINDYCLRCRRHQFAGVLSLVPYLPNPESFLSCNLWVASQVLWGRNPPELLGKRGLQPFVLSSGFRNLR
ncbi:MAG: hypothetical protein ACE5GN_07510, partial [Waddliaceae bacterium]